MVARVASRWRKPDVLHGVLKAVRTPLVVIVAAALLMAGCGEEAREAQPEAAAGPALQAPPPPVSETPASTKPSAAVVPLTPAQRRQLRAIATSIDNVADEFDGTVRACSHQPSCVDAAFALVVADLDWPPYYLQRIGARQRDCEPLTSAATGIYGFNLGVRQLDYAAMADDATRQRDQLALVDSLRPVPYDLRSAAASGCH
jgi:hypothetical protein